MSLSSRLHLLSTHDITRDELDEVFSTTSEMEQRLRLGASTKLLAGKILTSLFFEPSTRTRFSFESAMLHLGGQVISMESGFSSSLQKGESLEDTGRIISCYGDIIVVRHPEIGSAEKLARFARVPVINAGDGSNQHPTQALLDLYTIKKEKGRLHGLSVGVFGDLLYGRAVHSLLNLLTHYQAKIVMIAPEALMPPAELREGLRRKGVELELTSDLSAVIGHLDVLYCTRIQRERFPNLETYAALKGSYQLNQQIMHTAKSSCIILHPLPRLDEIPIELDESPHSRYFVQAQNGVYVRMAILWLLARNVIRG
jgi:aspartate carbamoyltransferase catalytic subunit